MKNLKTRKSYILQKTLAFTIICRNCGSKDGKIFKDEESIEILKMLDLIDDSQEFRLKEIEKQKKLFY